MPASEVRKRVLVVDDESNIRESLRLILGREYSVDVASDAEQALKILAESIAGVSAAGEPNPTNELSANGTQPDLVILDVLMPGLDGIGMLEKLRVDYPSLPVIMLTATNNVRTAVQAMKIGAVDYLSKPFDVDELLNLIDSVFKNGGLVADVGSALGKDLRETRDHLRPNLPKLPGDFGSMIGNHPMMAELYKKIDQLAIRDTTILITGESGTGKELVAREIHERSPRANGPFVALNCAAIPETLIESELFGHEKGAFTHAVERRVGHFELADRGTLFLDEIGELSLPVQVKMLRFLQEQEFYRIGRSKPIQVDVRIVAATNRSLEAAMREGRFRQDLYYRINVVTLDVPPLRERREDIPNLAQFFIKRMGALYGNRTRDITEAALKILQEYSWPGNVRELENVTESILALSGAEVIDVGDLPSRVRQRPLTGDMKQDVLDGNLPFEEAERAFETEIILKALRKTSFVQTKAAEMLGISRRILKYKMDKLGISEDGEENKAEHSE